MSALIRLLFLILLVGAPLALASCGGGGSVEGGGANAGAEGVTIAYSDITGECMKALDEGFEGAKYGFNDYSDNIDRATVAYGILNSCRGREIVAYVERQGGNGDMEFMRMCGLSADCDDTKGTEWDPTGDRTRAACRDLASDVGRDAGEYRYHCGTGNGAGGTT